MRIGFWYDIGIVAAFALVIFFWAQATKLPREEMENLVARQAAGSDDPNAEMPRH